MSDFIAQGRRAQDDSAPYGSYSEVGKDVPQEFVQFDDERSLNYTFYLDKIAFDDHSSTPDMPGTQGEACRLGDITGGIVTLVELWFCEIATSQCICDYTAQEAVTEKSLRTWLEEKNLDPTEDGSKFVGGLKMVILNGIDDFPKKLPVSREIFELIMRSFQIPHVFAEVILHADPIFTSFTSVDQKILKFVYRGTLIPDYAIAISHNLEDRITYALVLGKPEGRYINQNLLESLRRHKLMALNPLLLPILATGLATDRSRDMITSCREEADIIEETTGQHPYRQTEVYLKDSDLPGLRLDAIRTVCKCGIHQSVTKSRLLCLEQAQRLFSEDMFRITDPNMPKHYKEASCQLRDFVGYLKNINKSLLDKVQHAQFQAEIQLSVILNFLAKSDFNRNIAIAEQSRIAAEESKKLTEESRTIAQQSRRIAEVAANDSAVMRAIAAASKQDSSSMKAVAVLTMFFLPFTFLAALIENPLSRPDVFFGAAVGVTVLVYAIWGIWIYYFEMPKQRKETEIERQIAD